MRNIYYKPDGAWHLTQEEVAWINGAVEREAALRSQVEELTQEREQLKANLATRTFAANINSNAAKARKLDLQEAEAKLARVVEAGTGLRAAYHESLETWEAAVHAWILAIPHPATALDQPTQEQPE